jgi:hypothetical protein
VRSTGDGGRNEKIKRGEEDKNMLHVYVQRQCNKIYQILYEKRKEGGGMGI